MWNSKPYIAADISYASFRFERTGGGGIPYLGVLNWTLLTIEIPTSFIRLLPFTAKS
jgi:hypothetical protein